MFLVKHLYCLICFVVIISYVKKAKVCLGSWKYKYLRSWKYKYLRTDGLKPLDNFVFKNKVA